MRFRITVRGDHAELRGYIEGEDPAVLLDFADAMKPFGIVAASPAADDYDPFKRVDTRDAMPLIQRQSDLLTGVANALKGPPGELAIHDHADLPEVAAAMVRHHHERELHHFETEQIIDQARAILTKERDAEALKQLTLLLLADETPTPSPRPDPPEFYGYR